MVEEKHRSPEERKLQKPWGSGGSVLASEHNECSYSTWKEEFVFPKLQAGIRLGWQRGLKQVHFAINGSLLQLLTTKNPLQDNRNGIKMSLLLLSKSNKVTTH